MHNMYKNKDYTFQISGNKCNVQICQSQETKKKKTKKKKITYIINNLDE